MFDQTSRLAEKVAASVSRRGFLGSLGGWAAAAAIGVAGMLTVGAARAGGDKPTRVCMYTGGCTGQPVYCHGSGVIVIPCPYVCHAFRRIRPVPQRARDTSWVVRF
jgi:hypothetical protein